MASPPHLLLQGYHLALRTPSALDFFEPNRNIETEIDFNHYLYMTVRPVGGQQDWEDVAAETIKDIVSSPNSPWEERMKDMVMIDEGGSVDPIFLPNFVDVVGKADLKWVFKHLSNYEYEYEGMTQVVPKVFEGVTDPKPKLKFEGPIFRIAYDKVELQLGCFTDALAVYQLKENMTEFTVVVTKANKVKDDPASRFHGVRITPLYEGVEHHLIPGWSVIVWNVRHAARPSFKENFKKLLDLHHPIAILLTETRMYRESFVRFNDSLDCDLDWGLDESVGLMGGIALMWDKSRVKGKAMVSSADNQEIRMLATIKPLNAPDDPSSPEEADPSCCGSPEI